jgi:choline kinase
MKFPVRAVINAAGCGRRMGRQLPKCLVPILGRPLIEWQLQTLTEFHEVVVVVGYRSEEVREAVLPLRPDARFVFNPDYETTGTASSLTLGAIGSESSVLSLDGDLLVHPDDLRDLARSTDACIGVCPIQSIAPVYVELATGGSTLKADRFHRDEARLAEHFAMEWTGLVVYDPRKYSVHGRGHVFEMIESLLPCRALDVRCREIDYPEEIQYMESWLQTLLAEGVFNG